MMSDPEVVRIMTVWTARLTLVLFLMAFVLLGRRGVAPAQRLACRGAALAMVLHLLALSLLSALTGEGPLSFADVPQAVVSLGGAGAAAAIVAGWAFWDRTWYRWAVYAPWGVFLFTYLFLPRHGDTAARIVAAPLVFGPVVVVLLGALGWRLRLDLSPREQ